MPNGCGHVTAQGEAMSDGGPPAYRKARAAGLRGGIGALALFVAAAGFGSAPAPAHAADLVLDHVDIVDVEDRRVLRDGQIVISGSRIAYAGPRRPVPDGATVRDMTGHVALPGFVNAHTHLWQHASRGLKTSSDLQSWAAIVHQFLHYATREEMYVATRAAAAQAVLSGFTAVADFASPYSEFTLDATSRAIREAGLDGVILWWNPASFLPPSVKRRAMRRFARRIAPLKLWVAQGHAFLFDIPVRYEGVRLADELGVGLSEHTLETVAGIRGVYALDHAYYKKYGARLALQDRKRLKDLLSVGPPPKVVRVYWMRRLARQVLSDPENLRKLTGAERTRLKRWADIPATYSVAGMLDFIGAFDLRQPYVSIHSVWLDDAEIDLFRRKRGGVAYNPGSNLRLSSGIAPVWSLLKSGVTVGLGTDGAASNDGIDAFTSMRAAWNLQKIEMLDAGATGRQIDAWAILRMATIEGARLLRIDDRTGSLRAGKEADIVLLSRSALSLSPVFASGGYDTLVPMAIYSANVRSIATVISNGRIVVDGGKLAGGTSAAEHAARLNRVSNAVMARQARGKTWARRYDLGATGVDGGWHRYRSVRRLDRVSIVLTNGGGKPRTVSLAFSGAPEGGAAAPMLSAKTRARFPLQPPERYWSRTLLLPPGAAISIQKAPNGFDYTIRTPYETVRRTGAAEQMLILVEQ